MLNTGDRVTLAQDTLMNKAGVKGTVTQKHVPAHCTGAWYVVVQWDHLEWETTYPYPSLDLQKLAH